MEQLNFKVLDFEGPLDLLLALIKKNKVSIYDIPISTIVEQYFGVMRQMKEYNLDISSEFFGACGYSAANKVENAAAETC